MTRADLLLLVLLAAPWIGSCGFFRCPSCEPEEPFDRGTLVVTGVQGADDTASLPAHGFLLVDSTVTVTPEEVVLDTQAHDGSQVRVRWTVTSRD